MKQVRVFSQTPANRIEFAREMSAWLGVAVEAVDSAREAVVDMPIVSLATSSRAPVIEPQWITPGALVVSITSGQLPRATVSGSRVIVSWLEEVLGGEGPRQPYRDMIADGSWSADQIAGELGEVILGRLPAREKVGETVVFESAGMAAWDSTAAAWAYRWAVQQKRGLSFSVE